MNGCEAIAYGTLDAGVNLATGVIGFPVTQLIRRLKLIWRDTANEKIAVEIALGASVSGVRSAFITKHVGLNVGSDPLITAATHTIAAGLVAIVGDDPGAKFSQNEQDSRYYGKIAEIPVIDPCTPWKAYDSIIEAFEMSDILKVPVIVRVTDRLLKMEEEFERVTPKVPEVKKIEKDVWELTFFGRHQYLMKYTYPKMQEFAERSDLHEEKGNGITGIISSGYASTIVENVIEGRKDITHFKLGIVNPICDRRINSFLKKTDRVLVVEEGGPFIEEAIGRKLLGKLSGHLPRFGEITHENVEKALQYVEADYLNLIFDVETTKSRGYLLTICDDCPFMPFYRALVEINVMIAGDIGCVIRSSNPPFNLIDAAYSLGSAIGVAAGFKDGGIAILGDYAFLHSGIESLVSAILYNYNVKVFVLENRISAITGGQPVPEMSDLIGAICRNYGVYYKILDAACTEQEKFKDNVQTLVDTKGVAVIVLKGRCPKYS
ncbi:MAG TPA: thiamine pyrophosphate-dependent enzyme [Candidatus Acidoferrales bacterium]|nr:thiamine pyrophosphate-dependent enzyme [Candidatus Acidoferrales bacterium]